MTGKCFVDTNIFVYCRDKHDEHKRTIALNLVKDLWKQETGVISYQVITEFAAVLSKKFSVSDAKIKSEIDCLLSWKPIPIDECVIAEGLRIREHYHLSYWDSWIIGAALHSRCEILYSEDLQHLASYHGVKVINPFAQ